MRVQLIRQSVSQTNLLVPSYGVVLFFIDYYVEIATE